LFYLPPIAEPVPVFGPDTSLANGDAAMRRKKRAAFCSSGHQQIRILQLLIAHGELTGAQILQRDASLPRGTIYTTLMRLEASSLVFSRQAAGSGKPGPRRRFYKVTKRGAHCARLATELAEALASSR
jgi:DNA-binding PadR family transcriptional regulator